jgi:hypothetical protein
VRHRARHLCFVALAATIGATAGLAPRLLDRSATESIYDEDRSVTSLKLPGDASGTPRAIKGAIVAAPDRPVAAVEQFLAAEVAGDFATSYALLSRQDRAANVSASVWERRHATMPALRGFAGARVDGNAGAVSVAIDYDAVLDPVLGLVPAHAVAAFATRAEDGGHRVHFSETAITPLHLDPAGAANAAARWADASRRCASPPNQWRAELLGDGAAEVASSLCGARVTIADASQPFADRNGVEPFVAAFGSEVGTWARTVAVDDGRIASDLVLAPVGDEWIVIGAITSSSGNSG